MFVRVLSTALSSPQASVVIADDSTVAREGLAAIIQRDLGYGICGVATDERATAELVERHQPDLLVIEITPSPPSPGSGENWLRTFRVIFLGRFCEKPSF